MSVSPNPNLFGMEKLESLKPLDLILVQRGNDHFSIYKKDCPTACFSELGDVPDTLESGKPLTASEDGKSLEFSTITWDSVDKAGSSLHEMDDVKCSGVKKGDILHYDGNSWSNRTLDEFFVLDGTTLKLNPAHTIKEINLCDITIGNDGATITQHQGFPQVKNRGGTPRTIHTEAIRGGSTGIIYSGTVDSIEKINIASMGDSKQFQGLVHSHDVGKSGCSNGSHGVAIFSGNSLHERVNIHTEGNAYQHGLITPNPRRYSASMSNAESQRGVICGGITNHNNTVANISLFTINTCGNSGDQADLTQSRAYASGCSDGVNNIGIIGSDKTTEYIRLQYLNESNDFVSLRETRNEATAVSNGTGERGLFAGGTDSITNIEYVTINLGNSAHNFGELTTGRERFDSVSNGFHALFIGGRGDIETTEHVVFQQLSNAAEFGQLIESRHSFASTSDF